MRHTKKLKVGCYLSSKPPQAKEPLHNPHSGVMPPCRTLVLSASAFLAMGVMQRFPKESAA